MRSAKRTIRNSIYSLSNQIITLLLALILRKLTIHYIGVEVLGISSAFASFLETLSLAELGFNTAITFFLYKPLHEKNYKEVSSIIAVFRFVYLCVAGFIFIAALIFAPFIGLILKGTQISITVYIFYLLAVLDSVATYLLSYKRILLYADQNEYYSQRVDVILNLVFGCIRVWIIVETRQYELFLLTKVLQTIISNAFIHFRCNKLYPQLKPQKLNTILLKDIFMKVKHVFGSKLAYYINSSTDSLVISSIIGTVIVGMFTNYTTITIGIKRLVVSLLKPVSPMLGDLLADKTVDVIKREQTLRNYTHITYLIATVTLIPTAVLLDPFISVIYGEDFCLNPIITLLLVLDLYITIIHRGCCDYINGQGLFEKDKIIEYIAAFLNITISIIMAYVLGVIGVLIGTIISGIFTWIGRSYIVYSYSLNVSKRRGLSFLILNLKYIATFAVSCCVCEYAKVIIPSSIPFVIWFVLIGILCEVISLLLYCLLFSRSAEHRFVASQFKELMTKR